MNKLAYGLLGMIAGIIIGFMFVADKCQTSAQTLARVRCNGNNFSTAIQNPLTGEIIINCGQSIIVSNLRLNDGSGTIDPL